MPLPQPLTEPAAELIAHRFRLLAEPMRVRILDRLRTGEANVHELAEGLGTTPQNVSKHLGVLSREGIVARRKAGNFAYYRVVDEGIWQLCHLVCAGLEERFEGLRLQLV